MDWQTFTTWIVVACAAGYLVRRWWKNRRRPSPGGCGGNCGCPAKPKSFTKAS